MCDALLLSILLSDVAALLLFPTLRQEQRADANGLCFSDFRRENTLIHKLNRDTSGETAEEGRGQQKNH